MYPPRVDDFSCNAGAPNALFIEKGLTGRRGGLTARQAGRRRPLHADRAGPLALGRIRGRGAHDGAQQCAVSERASERLPVRRPPCVCVYICTCMTNLRGRRSWQEHPAAGGGHAHCAAGCGLWERPHDRCYPYQMVPPLFLSPRLPFSSTLPPSFLALAQSTSVFSVRCGFDEPAWYSL